MKTEFLVLVDALLLVVSVALFLGLFHPVECLFECLLLLLFIELYVLHYLLLAVVPQLSA
jgi:hypothetical protein